LLAARQADVVQLRESHEKARQATAAALAQLGAEQQRLFEAQRAVATGVDRNLDLEQQIRNRERGLSQGK
jgi:hypothetical protein